MEKVIFSIAIISGLALINIAMSTQWVADNVYSHVEEKKHLTCRWYEMEFYVTEYDVDGDTIIDTEHGRMFPAKSCEVR